MFCHKHCLKKVDFYGKTHLKEGEPLVFQKSPVHNNTLHGIKVRILVLSKMASAIMPQAAGLSSPGFDLPVSCRAPFSFSASLLL
jgi:hypothetical protein